MFNVDDVCCCCEDGVSTSDSGDEGRSSCDVDISFDWLVVAWNLQ